MKPDYRGLRAHMQKASPFQEKAGGIHGSPHGGHSREALLAEQERVRRQLAGEKVAGAREALRVFLTGKVPVRHGTTKAVAKKIRATGLRPQGSAGISSLLAVPGEEGLAFTTRSKAMAKNYAQQAEGLAKAKALRRHIPIEQKRQILNSPAVQGMQRQFEATGSSANMGDVLQAQAGRALSFFGKGDVVEARVPWKKLRAREAPGRELHAPVVKSQREALSQIHPSLEQVPAAAFMTDVPVRGGLPAEYIKGSPSYMRTSVGSLRDHLRSIKDEPKAFGKEVLRAYAGMQHRPSTLLGQDPALRRRLLGVAE